MNDVFLNGAAPRPLGAVVWGCANQLGEDPRNVDRTAVLLESAA